MKGQLAVVTGGTRGIGLAITERMIARGAQVAAVYFGDGEYAKALKEAHPDDVTLYQRDISEWELCEMTVRDILEDYGRLDVLVNNAGITRDRTARKMTPLEWEEVIGVNLSGTFYMSRAVLNHMIDKKYGRIINISSVVGERGNFGQANYAASKSGLFGLTKTLAIETAGKGITVNSITPGFIKTEMVAAMPEEVLAKIVAQIPVGRLGTPNEVARLVEFLADPESGYITGEVYGINGGFYM